MYICCGLKYFSFKIFATGVYSAVYIPLTDRVQGPYCKLRNEFLKLSNLAGPYSEIRPAKLTNHNARTNLEV